MVDFTKDDIRAAVAAGALSELQAAQLLAIAEGRKGFRQYMNEDDEPFELFKGFSEIFVTVGLALLTSGVVALSMVTGNPLGIPLVAAILSVLFARYFTLRRRMTLPSIFLVATFGVSMFALTALMFHDAFAGLSVGTLMMFATTGLALLAYFRVFRVPFSLFLVGLCGVGIAYSLTAFLLPDLAISEAAANSVHKYLDLGRSPALALTLLGFGLLAFAGAMFFDLKDPHRISRHAANAFWLHILAAPSIVNVVSVSLLGIGGNRGFVLAALGLLVVTVLALIIDRRSFLAAGIVYIGVILTWAISTTSVDETWGIVWTLLLMGSFITALGSWWVPLRGRLMRILPDFPFKTQLPPYSESA